VTFSAAIHALGGQRYEGGILSAASRFGIDTALRQAHWLAQIAHESGRFRYVREIWGPTPAQKRYEGRADLGNTEPGDGKRFLGRGFIQITGRANYQAASMALYGNAILLDRPELLELNPALSAGWFWATHKINRHADRDDLIAVTKAINGGLTGLDDRKDCLEVAKKAMGV
jgi:putative chitinase